MTGDIGGLSDAGSVAKNQHLSESQTFEVVSDGEKYYKKFRVTRRNVVLKAFRLRNDLEVTTYMYRLCREICDFLLGQADASDYAGLTFSSP